MSNRLIIRDGDADTATIAEYEATRRDAVRRGLTAGGAVLGAAMIPALLGARNAFAQASGDAAIVSGAITLENTAVAACDAALKSGKLDAGATKVVKIIRDQEQEHAKALTAALKGLGGTPPAGPNQALLKPLSSVRSQADIAMFAVELETMAVAAYYMAHGKLKDAKLLMAGASIMANEGQHLVFLRQALMRDPFPNAFETGQK